MAEQGWISLHRKIMDSWVWKDKPFSRGQAWIDLLMSANHEDKKIPFDGALYEVKRGSHITSIRKLSQKWGWSTTKAKRFLDALQSDGMVTYFSDTKKTIVSIVNYNVYQDTQNSESNTEVSPKYHRSNTEVTPKNTNNNDNNIRCCSCNAISKEEYVNKAVNYYCTKAGILDANFKTTDIAALMEIYQDGLPFEIVIKGIDDAFKSFKPKYKDDKINSFKFCVPIIRSLHEREKAKEVDNNAETGGDTQSKSGEMSDEARKFYSRGLD